MKERTGILLCLLASFLWGMAFVAQSSVTGVMGALSFNGIRSLIGFVVLLPMVIRILKSHKGDKKYYRSLVIATLACGAPLFIATNLQQWGIEYTTAGKAAFITALYTLIVPILSVLLKKKVTLRNWICVGIGLVGAFLLSINGDSGIGYGDMLVLICSFFFALQIVLIDVLAKDLDGIELSAFQFLLCGVLGCTVGFATEPISWEIVRQTLVPILYAGIFSCGIAYTLQTVCLKYVNATKATLALSMESAWGAIGGAVLLGEMLSVKELFGCLLLFSAVIVSQLPEKMKKSAESTK